MEHDLPKSETLTDWLRRLKRNEKSIVVRERVDGNWLIVPLSDLSPERWAYWVATWLEG